jgi:type IX secretion system PorP/SprF family membrane protein
VHSGFRKARVGLGVIFGNDQIGVHSDNSLYGVYSYKIPLSRRKNGGVLSMGIQGGFNSLRSDYFKTTPRDGAEVGVISKFNPNFGAGVFYRTNDLYAGLSVPYMLSNKIIDIIDMEMDTTFSTSGKQQRYYYLTGGFTKKLSPTLKWMPSALVRIQNNAPLSFDFNSMFILHDVVGMGFSYRLGDSFIGLFELQINENFHVGYAYDITTSDLRLYSNGTHEIMINYRIKIPRLHTGIPCPSYW